MKVHSSAAGVVLTATKPGYQVGSDAGQAVQGICDVVQGGRGVAIQLALGLQEVVHRLHTRCISTPGMHASTPGMPTLSAH